MERIFRCGPSCEDHRPMIDFDLPVNAKNDWLTIGKVVEGRLPAGQFPESVKITVPDPRATRWDCFMDGGTRGLFSRRFAISVGKNALSDFQLMPAKLNEEDYFFLRRIRSRDVLDREKSDVITFPHDPIRVMEIRHYVFRHTSPDSLPQLFCIPETPELLASETIADVITRTQLRGIRLDVTP